MVLWFFILLPLLAVGESQPRNQINQTDLRAAMADMRGKSYHGFVILLNILTSIHNSLESRDITFLMPNDQELSETALTADRLHDFIHGHSIPTALLLNHLLRFPTGTLIPSSLPNRMISVTNNGRSGILVNNAKIVTPNVCLSSIIRCHGISTAIKFDAFGSEASLPTLPTNLRSLELTDLPGKTDKAKSSSSTNKKRGLPFH